MAIFQITYYAENNTILAKEKIEAHDHETATTTVLQKLKNNVIDIVILRGEFKTHELILADKIVKIQVAEPEALRKAVTEKPF